MLEESQREMTGPRDYQQNTRYHSNISTMALLKIIIIIVKSRLNIVDMFFNSLPDFSSLEHIVAYIEH